MSLNTGSYLSFNSGSYLSFNSSIIELIDLNNDNLIYDTLKIRQKRNSCIAVMNHEFPTTTSATPTVSSSNNTNNNHSPQTLAVPIPDANLTNRESRDSVCSFQSYLPSSLNSPESSPIERSTLHSSNSKSINKKFRQMYLSNIFVNYNSKNKVIFILL